jgi:hypothetical protein
LRNPSIQPNIFKLLLTPAAGKEAALIRLWFKVNLEDTWQLALMKGHCDG